MGSIKAHIAIKRPIEEVFDYVSHFENDVQWWFGIKESRVTSAVKHGLGTQYWQLSTFLGRRNETTFEITEYAPVHHITLRSIQSPIPFTARYLLERDDVGTRFSMDAEVNWLGFYKYAQPFFNFMMQQIAHYSFKKLKNVLESSNRL